MTLTYDLDRCEDACDQAEVAVDVLVPDAEAHQCRVGRRRHRGSVDRNVELLHQRRRGRLHRARDTRLHARPHSRVERSPLFPDTTVQPRTSDIIYNFISPSYVVAQHK